MKNMCNCAGKPCGNHHLGMFFLRVVAGIVFVYAGWWKLHNVAATVAGMAASGLPAWMAHVVTWLELVGGVALILGIFTCFFASIFALEMAVATILSWKMGFQIAELPLLMTAVMVALKHGGRGKWGMGRHCGCLMCGLGGRKANVCQACGHEPGMGQGCGCDCHK